MPSPPASAPSLRSRNPRKIYAQRDAPQMKVILISLYSVLVVFTAVILLEGTPLLSDNCTPSIVGKGGGGQTRYSNPDYSTDLCLYERSSHLLFLTPMECDLSRRLLVSVLAGGIIGWERRDADRPAGIRTMSLVTLGSCLFTITSMFSFSAGPMSWDASRVAAAIPSGVGFLGAGLIWKGEAVLDGGVVHQVHGLTTAASVWLSAAVGVALGGKMYAISLYTLTLIVLTLRFGPRLYFGDDNSVESDSDDGEGFSDNENESTTIPIEEKTPLTKTGNVSVEAEEGIPLNWRGGYASVDNFGRGHQRKKHSLKNKIASFHS